MSVQEMITPSQKKELVRRPVLTPLEMAWANGAVRRMSNWLENNSEYSVPWSEFIAAKPGPSSVAFKDYLEIHQPMRQNLVLRDVFRQCAHWGWKVTIGRNSRGEEEYFLFEDIRGYLR